MEVVRVLRGRDRRRAQRFFVFHERRSGFDRRLRSRAWAGTQLDAALIHVRDHPGVLVALLLLANVLSLADLALTRLALAQGAAEVNPLMDHLLTESPTSAAAFKVAVGVAASVAVWAYRRQRRMLGLALCLPLVYACLVLYEIAGIALL